MVLYACIQVLQGCGRLLSEIEREVLAGGEPGDGMGNIRLTYTCIYPTSTPFHSTMGMPQIFLTRRLIKHLRPSSIDRKRAETLSTIDFIPCGNT